MSDGADIRWAPVHLAGRLDKTGVAEVADRLEGVARKREHVQLDLSAVEHVDSSGAAVLSLFCRRMRAANRQLRIIGARPNVARTLAVLPFAEPLHGEPTPRGSAMVRLGESTAAAADAVLRYATLCADVCFFAASGVFRRGAVRWGAVAYEMSTMGSRALGVVGLIAFLVGGTMALQAAAQLRRFGANIFVVDLVAVSITRELGPLMTAIVLAGRSGSAVAAEVGTMVITEEVDALRTMGINPIRFLVVPKVIAIVVALPLLTVLADALAIGGGMVVGVTYLDIAPAAFIDRLTQALFVKDLMTGLVKSVLFAFVIVTVGATVGLHTRGGADAVGRSTTASVVAGIFAVIVTDAVCSLVFYFGG